MEKHNYSYFKTVQTNEDSVVMVDECEVPQRDINPRSINERNVTKSASRNVIKNDFRMPQNLSVTPARYVDKSRAVNNSTFDSSRIDEILHHSERNKAVINSVLTKFSGKLPTFGKNSQSQSIASFTEISLSNKLAFKQISDEIRRESQNVMRNEDKSIDVFMQTDNVQYDHKSTQTDLEFLYAYYNNSKINMDLNYKMFQDFIRVTKHQFYDFLYKLQSLFLQNMIQPESINDKLRNDCQETSFVNGENACSSASNKFANAGRNPAVNAENKFANAGRNPAVNAENMIIDTSSQAIFNTASTHAVTDANNNYSTFNAVMPVQRPILQVAPSPVMQPRGSYAANQSAQLRPMRARNEEYSARFAPYPRQPFWHQSEYNGQRQTSNVQEPYHFNGWQAPNTNNPRPFFDPRQYNHPY